MIKLFGHDTSPYVRRIRVLLAELGLAFERDSRSWTVADADVLRLNPMLRVPALSADRDDGTQQQLLDSKIIAAFLYEEQRVSGQPLPHAALPVAPTMFDAASRWDDENLLSMIDAATDSTINLFVLELDGITRDKSAYLQRQQSRTESCLRYLDDKLAGRTTFHEGRWSYLDIALTCSLDWMIFRDRYPVGAHPNLVRFLAEHAARPSLSSTHPRLAANAALPKASAK